MDKLEIGVHLFFLGALLAIIGTGAFWSVMLAYRVMAFVV